MKMFGKAFLLLTGLTVFAVILNVSSHEVYKLWDENAKQSSNVSCGRFTIKDNIQRIAGGFTARRGQFPSFVQINIPEGGGMEISCGGTIVSKNYVITAAHCVVNNLHKDIRIQTGDGQVYMSKKTCMSRKYDEYFYVYDVAVIKLESEIRMSDEVQPACFLNRKVNSNDQVYAVGMGLVDSFHSADKLQVLPVKRVRCHEPRETVICFRANLPRYRGDTCQGDSGSGLYIVINNIQYAVALTSFGGKICAEGWVGISGNTYFLRVKDELKELMSECR